MKSVLLIRDDISSECIRGKFIVGGEIFQTLERPWLDNRNNTSCIPAGEYEIAYLTRSASGKYRNIYQVLNVPRRGGILIHNGNIVDHTHGCILVGLRRGILAGRRAITNSRTALARLVETTGKEKFKLHVIGGVTW